jgi:hypothetical protein
MKLNANAGTVRILLLKPFCRDKQLAAVSFPERVLSLFVALALDENSSFLIRQPEHIRPYSIVPLWALAMKAKEGTKALESLFLLITCGSRRQPANCFIKLL